MPGRALAALRGNGSLLMGPDMVPASLMMLLQRFAPLFTAPSFRTFTALACGFLAQSGQRTVCGMLTGAGLSRVWPHDRARCFFSRAWWSPDGLGICAAELVISRLVPDGEPVEVRIGGTLFSKGASACGQRHGFMAEARRDPRKQGPGTTGWCWPCACGCRSCPPAAVPVMAELVIKGHHVRLAAVAGPPDGHPPGGGTARPPGECHR